VRSRNVATAVALTAFAMVAPERTRAQGPVVGEPAPDFTLKGSTMSGLLPAPIHLADFRGRTVVLAFFPKARTKG